MISNALASTCGSVGHNLSCYNDSDIKIVLVDYEILSGSPMMGAHVPYGTPLLCIIPLPCSTEHKHHRLTMYNRSTMYIGEYGIVIVHTF